MGTKDLLVQDLLCELTPLEVRKHQVCLTSIPCKREDKIFAWDNLGRLLCLPRSAQGGSNDLKPNSEIVFYVKEVVPGQRENQITLWYVLS